jgi:hypothetical protein
MMLEVKTYGMFINNVGPFEYTMQKDTQFIDVTDLGDTLEVDPEWFHIDENGHFHAFNMDTQLTPTLKHVTETVDEYWGGSTVVDEHRCVICNASVTPNYVVRHAPPLKTISGPTTTTFVIDKYAHDAHMGQQVSFYSGLMFGLAHITHVHVTPWSEYNTIKVKVEFTCDFLARRGSNGNL